MLVVNVPGINGLGKTLGCEKAGYQVLLNLKEIHSNEQGKSISVGDLNLEEIRLNNSNLITSNAQIYKLAFKFFEENNKIVFLGGDHSVSYSLTRAFFDHCQNSGRESCLIVFDAHADLMAPMKEPTHEEWLRKLIEDRFPAENVLLVGLRNLWKDETFFLNEKKIKTIGVNQLMQDLENSCDIIMEFTRGRETYISIDIDVLDPVFAPGTGYREPGGVSSREFIYLIQRLNKMKNLRAVDIVEINPDKDVDQLTVKLGAKILSELI